MKDLVTLLIWIVVVGVIFGVLWYKGALLRISNYVMETREELRKCTWPTMDELKGSTVVILITIILLGGFLVGIDFIISQLIRLIA